MFATPETQIGFHPDAGASFYLSHLPGYLGKFLSKFMSRKERLFIFILLQLPFCTISLCHNLTLISLSHLAFHCWHLFSSISFYWTVIFKKISILYALFLSMGVSWQKAVCPLFPIVILQVLNLSFIMFYLQGNTWLWLEQSSMVWKWLLVALLHTFHSMQFVLLGSSLFCKIVSWNLNSLLLKCIKCIFSTEA